MIDNKKLLTQIFLQAVKVPSPTGSEKEMALWLEEYMSKLGWQTWIDNTGKLHDSNTGNLYAYLFKSKKLKTLVFCSHMDTVQKSGDVIKPQFDGRYFKSDGSTILGADNKAGVTAMLALASTLDKAKISHNILFFFSTREENGVMGSSYFVFEKNPIEAIYNIDNSDKFENFVTRALGYSCFSIEVNGKSVHAAKEYSKGIDAIAASGELIGALPLGSHKEDGWTLNIGSIKGGHSTNVVCDKVILSGELRFFDVQVYRRMLKRLRQICMNISNTTSANIVFNLDKTSFIPTFSFENSPIESQVKNACKRLGLTPKFKTVFATSDSNFLSSFGYPCITVSRGGENPHSVEETLDIVDLEKCLEFLRTVVEL